MKMSYIFEKHSVERFEVTNVSRNFMKFSSFSRVRKDIKNCAFCEHVFEPNDQLNLIFVKNKKNQLICDTCAEKATNSGVETSEFNRK